MDLPSEVVSRCLSPATYAWSVSYDPVLRVLCTNENPRPAGHNVTKIGLPETGLGIIPGAGGTQRVTRLLGPSRAKDLIFTARALTAQECLDWGLVNYVSTPETTGYDRALTLTESITRNGKVFPFLWLEIFDLMFV